MFTILANCPQNEDEEKRQRWLSRKALESAYTEKITELSSVYIKVSHLVEQFNKTGVENLSESELHNLEVLSDELRIVLKEIGELHLQDKHGLINDADLVFAKEREALDRATTLILVVKNKDCSKSDKLSDTGTRSSRKSHRSTRTGGSAASSARLRALKEAAAARENEEYDRIIAAKELELRHHEAEEEKKRELARAQHAKEIALLNSQRKSPIAMAKLKAVEDVLELEEGLTRASNREGAVSGVSVGRDIPGVPNEIGARERIANWVLASATAEKEKVPPVQAPRLVSTECAPPLIPTPVISPPAARRPTPIFASTPY